MNRQDIWAWTQSAPAGHPRAFRTIGVVLAGAALAYVCAFMLLSVTPGRILLDTLANVLPLAILGPAIWAGTRALANAPTIVRTALHPILSILFSLIWYLAVIVLVGIGRSALVQEFTVQPFYLAAAVWQIVHGAAVYALFAVLASWPEAAASPAPGSSPDRLLVREGDDMVLLDFDDVIRAEGRDDYSEIFTSRGSRLARIGLAELERALPSGRFMRVHRSHIVNLDRMQRAERAGAGRITLHMTDGSAITTSRAGARNVRSRLV